MKKGKVVSLEVPLKERIKIFLKTLYIIDRYFGHWEGASFDNIDEIYDRYINKIIRANDRQAMFMAMSELVASLNNGHSIYFDNVLGSKSLGFSAFYHDKLQQWVISQSSIAEIRPGDIINSINKIPIERFYKHLSRHIYGSSDRMKRNNLFWPIFLPERFNIAFDDSRVVNIIKQNYPSFSNKSDRVNYFKINAEIGYLKIKDFGTENGISSEAEAIKAVKDMWDCKSLIIDVRGNEGGATPLKLIKLLMDREWKGELFAYRKQDTTKEAIYNIYSGKKPKTYEYVYEKQRHYKPFAKHYNGHLFMLANQYTISAAEDFLIPFKMSKRALIIGSRTTGSTGDTYRIKFDDIHLIIGAYRCWFPDGSEFEGIGIKPDITIYPSINDLKEGKDTELNKALQLINEGFINKMRGKSPPFRCRI